MEQKRLRHISLKNNDFNIFSIKSNRNSKRLSTNINLKKNESNRTSFKLNKNLFDDGQKPYRSTSVKHIRNLSSLVPLTDRRIIVDPYNNLDPSNIANESSSGDDFVMSTNVEINLPKKKIKTKNKKINLKQ